MHLKVFEFFFKCKYFRKLFKLHLNENAFAFDPMSVANITLLRRDAYLDHLELSLTCGVLCTTAHSIP